jgi:transcriptional regulator with XRE-family HTH domain
MTTDNTASTIFKEARLKKGLTQVELAEKAGLYPNHVQSLGLGSLILLGVSFQAVQEAVR